MKGNNLQALGITLCLVGLFISGTEYIKSMPRKYTITNPQVFVNTCRSGGGMSELHFDSKDIESVNVSVVCRDSPNVSHRPRVRYERP